MATLLANVSQDWAPGGNQYSEKEVAAALKDMASSGSFCSAATTKEACLVPLMDPQLPAFNGTCAPVLSKLEGCCRNEKVLALPARNLTGTLPMNFYPAREYTDFSYNPNLCGVIHELPLVKLGRQFQPRMINNSQPFINLYNSNVKLDLPALAKQDRTIGPQVAYWLGVGRQGQPVLTYNNLQGHLPAAQSIHVCSLFSQGELQGFNRTAKCSNSSSSNQQGDMPAVGAEASSGTVCNCSSKSAIEDIFKGRKSKAEVWAACHPEQLYLSFPNSIQQYRAQLHYNAYAEQHDQAVSCGAQGWHYRLVRVIVIWVVTLPVALLGLGLYEHYKDGVLKSLQAENPGSGSFRRIFDLVCSFVFSPVAQLLGRLGLCFYDVAMDAIFVAELGSFGNFYGVAMLGWPILISGTLGYAVSVARLWYRYVRKRPEMCKGWGRYGVLVAVVVFGGVAVGCLAAIVLAACVQQYLASQAGGYQMLLLGDAWVLALLFVVPGAIAQGLAGMYGVFWRIQSELPDNGALTGWDTFAWDAVGLLLEDVPQGILQGYLWLTGKALVSTQTYALSAVGTALSIAHNLVLLSPAFQAPLRSMRGCLSQHVNKPIFRKWVGQHRETVVEEAHPIPDPPSPYPSSPLTGTEVLRWLFGVQSNPRAYGAGV